MDEIETFIPPGVSAVDIPQQSEPEQEPEAGQEPETVQEAPKRRRGRPRKVEAVQEPEAPRNVFRVSLKYCEPMDIAAANEEEAFEAYKAAKGIIQSDHIPKIVRA